MWVSLYFLKKLQTNYYIVIIICGENTAWEEYNWLKNVMKENKK